MKVIGILGGVASGKTFVARQLQEQGAEVLDADRTGHAVLRLPAIREAAVQRWGLGMLGPDGQLNRKQLASIVFGPAPGGPRELAFLEGLTHEEIGRRLAAQAAEMTGRGVLAAVLDAPVMLKAGWNRLCDKIVYVDAPEDVRRSRAAARGWSREDFDAREAAQESLDEKRRHSDLHIDNSGAPEYTRAQIEHVWHSLVD